MENNLQKWFTAAADAEPIVNMEEVGAMIHTSPRSVRVKPTFKKFMIMGASFVLIASMVYWMHSPAPQKMEAKVPKTGTEQHHLPETKREQHPELPQQVGSQKVNNVATVSRKEDVSTEVLSAANDGQVAGDKPISNAIDFQHRIIYLTEKEFEKLDVHVDKNGYNHYYKTYADQQKIKATQLRSIHDSFYFAAGYPGKNYFIKPWESDYHPLYLTDSLGNQQQCFHFQDCPGNQTYRQFTDSLRDDFLKSYTNLLPIAIRTAANGKLHILWYRPTEALLKRLPSNDAILYRYDAGRNSFQFRTDEPNEEQSVYLSVEELARLGIRTDGNTLEYLNQYDTSVFHLDYKPKQPAVMAMVIRVSESGSMSSNNVHAKDSVLNRYSNEAVPLVITHFEDKDGKESFNILNKRVPYTQQSVFIKKMKQQLIPVVVKTKAKAGLFKTDRTFIFWYKNDVKFRSKLSDAYAQHFSGLPDFSEQYLEYYIQELREEDNREAEKYRPTQVDLKDAQKRFTTMTKPELKKLGIQFNGKKLDYKLISYTIDSHLVVIDLGVTPDMYMLNNRHQSGKKQKLKWNTRFAWYITDSSLNISSNFVDPLSQIGNHKADEERMQKMNQLFKQRMDSLVPVLVIFNDDAVKQAKYKSPQTHLVFWFPKSDEVQQVIKEAELKEAQKAEVKETAIGAIHYLELADSDLKQLGITKEGKFLKVPNISNEKHLSYSRYSKSYSEHIFTLGSDSLTSSPPEKGDIMITAHSPFAKPMKVKSSYPKELYPEPILITDGTGLHWRLYQSEDDPLTLAEKDSLVKNHINPWTNKKYVQERRARNKEWLIRKLNTMIAIRVKSDEPYTETEDANTALHPDLIIWYIPDSLFLSRLPIALAQQIRDELNHVQSNSTGSSCTFFESCANTTGVITGHLLYPNPTEDKSTLSLTLGDTRNISVSITDISGKTVKVICSKQTFTAGSHAIGVSLGGLSEGMYLLLIESEQGEHIVQRVVKK